MAWQMKADMWEWCSCAALCPCWLGPAGAPDKGWCAAAILYDIKQGSIDGVDVSGTKAVLTAEWPGNFFGGNGKARMYIDQGASDQQRLALEAVFSGKKGGLFEGLMGAVISKWLPSKTTAIDVQRGGTPAVSIGQFGKVTLTPFKNEAGQPTIVQGAAAQGAFQSKSMQLASGKGSLFSDPDFRQWEADSATIHDSVNWSA
jgi:hypothetical protein